MLKRHFRHDHPRQAAGQSRQGSAETYLVAKGFKG